MNCRFFLLLAILSGCSPLLQAADPEVSNFTASKHPGTKLAEIY